MSKPYQLGWREFQHFRHNQLDSFYRLTAKLGRVVHLRIFGKNVYLISEPEVIRELLVRQSNHLHRDPVTTQVLGRIIGNGLFIAEDGAWQRQRKLVQPVFHAAHIQDYVDCFAEQARAICASWQPGTTQQLDQEMMGLALRIICQTMFGSDVSAQVREIGTLMQRAMVEAEAQLRLGLPLPDWLPLPGLRRQRRAVNGIKALLLTLIHQEQMRLASGGDPNGTLLSMLLSARDEEDQPLSDMEVLDECMTIFVAGHETTAVALTWAWLLLLQHPPMLAKLQDEIHQTIGNRPITHADLDNLPYLGQVVKETLRFYPPAPGFGRTPTERFTVQGTTFQPGDTLIVNIYTVHHQADFYPDPETFRPERFAPTAAQPPRYAYLPFGAGPRTCIGNAFAMLEMQVVLATMIQSLTLSLAPGQTFEPETVVTLRPRNGVAVHVEAAHP